MPAPRIKAPSQSTVEKEFKEFLAITDQVEQLELRKDELKARLLQAAAEKGQEDDKGSAFLELTAPLEFTDYRGRTHKYLSIKRERYLRRPFVQVNLWLQHVIAGEPRFPSDDEVNAELDKQVHAAPAPGQTAKPAD